MDSQSITVNREWLDKLRAGKAALEKRIQQLEGTLSLYADEDNWDTVDDPYAHKTLWIGSRDNGWAYAAKALADGDTKP